MTTKKKTKPRTPKQLKQDQRKRDAENGYIELQVRIHVDHKDDVKAYAAKRTEPKS